MTRPSGGGRILTASKPVGVSLAVAVIAAALALAVNGCSSTPGPGAQSAVEDPSAAPVDATATAQTCAGCNGKGVPPKVDGTGRLENGVQVIEIGVKDGYYSPNAVTARAGLSTRVVFSGKAKGCLAKPTFSSLGKKADLSSGTATLDLGTLDPGTYTFTCGMGMNEGSIVAR